MMGMTKARQMQTALEIAERANRNMQGWLSETPDENIVGSLMDRGDGADQDIDSATSGCMVHLWRSGFWEGIDEDEQQLILDIAIAIHRSSLVEMGKLMAMEDDTNA